MTFDEALAGKEIPDEIRKSLVLINVPFFSFDGEVREGQLVVHTEVAEEVQEIFKKLLEMQFPIKEITPVVAYAWNDNASMAANNTSAFNYRVNVNTPSQLSNHAYGRAIDINPLLNPFVKGERVLPPGATYDVTRPGTVTGEVAALFKSRGWEWGGEFDDRKDWQHFARPV